MPSTTIGVQGQVMATCLCGCEVSTQLGRRQVTLDAVIIEPETIWFEGGYGAYSAPEFLYYEVDLDGLAAPAHQIRITVTLSGHKCVIHRVGWDERDRVLRTYPDEGGIHYTVTV